MSQSPSGWYPDPSGAPQQRYFDGTTWTQRTTGDVGGAVSDLESLVADQIRDLGADHRDVLATRAILAARRAMAGQRADALFDYNKLIRDQVRILGADHPDTLDTRKALARLRASSRAGRAQAIKDYEGLLADQIRILGADHPDTLSTRQGLVNTRRGPAICQQRCKTMSIWSPSGSAPVGWT